MSEATIASKELQNRVVSDGEIRQAIESSAVLVIHPASTQLQNPSTGDDIQG